MQPMPHGISFQLRNRIGTALFLAGILCTLTGCLGGNAGQQEAGAVSVDRNRPTVEGPVFVYQGDYITLNDPIEAREWLVSEEDVQLSADYTDRGRQYHLSIEKIQEIVLYDAAQPITATVRNERADSLVFEGFYSTTFGPNVTQTEPLGQLLKGCDIPLNSASVQEMPPFQLRFSGENSLQVMFAPLYRCYCGVMTVTDQTGQLETTVPVVAMCPVAGDDGAEGVYYPKSFYVI